MSGYQSDIWPSTELISTIEMFSGTNLVMGNDPRPTANDAQINIIPPVVYTYMHRHEVIFSRNLFSPFLSCIHV